MRYNARRVTMLSKRLRAAEDMLGYAHTIWDVGCDHGYLAVSLIERGSAEQVYATDISGASVAKTARLALERGLEGRIVTAQADGLAAFDPEGCFKLALCGMGGELIAQILDAGREKAQRAELIVMQPMRGEEELRRYLYESGYSFEDELVVYDAGRYYQLIAVRYGGGEEIPEWFPKGYYRFGWVMCERPTEALVSLLKKYRGVYARQLAEAQRFGRSPEKLVEELETVDAIIAHVKSVGAWVD